MALTERTLRLAEADLQEVAREVGIAGAAHTDLVPAINIARFKEGHSAQFRPYLGFFGPVDGKERECIIVLIFATSSALVFCLNADGGELEVYTSEDLDQEVAAEWLRNIGAELPQDLSNLRSVASA